MIITALWVMTPRQPCGQDYVLLNYVIDLELRRAFNARLFLSSWGFSAYAAAAM
jgi:hypothetical protein